MVLEFDIAAVFVELVVLFFIFNKKNIRNVQNRVFQLLSIVALFCSIFDYGTAAINEYNLAFPRYVILIANCVYYTLINWMALICLYYAYACCADYKYFPLKKGRFLFNVINFPFFVSLILIWLSPIVSDKYVLCFYLDEANVYHRGSGFAFYYLYVVSALYLFKSIYMVSKNRQKIEKSKRIAFLSYLLTVWFTVMIQLIFKTVLVECFGIAIATLVFFVYIQKPEEVIDPQTGLFNQLAFAQTTNRILSTDSTCVSIILDDISFLINTFGISQVNKFYKDVADYLRQNFKNTQIYSLEKGTFCIVYKNSELKHIDDVIYKIQNRFRQKWINGTVEIKLYSRICVIRCPETARTPEEVIDIINFVTYDERYKQGVVLSTEMDIENKKRSVYIERILRTGLQEGRYNVYYQPLYSTEKKRIIGAEALIRLQDENGEFISPEDFIPIAEKTGTILRIGEFVFESVCKTLSSINPEEYGIEKVDINLSMAQCMQEILAEQILSIKSMYRVPSSVINLEITETAAAHTPAILLRNMEKLTAAGIELSLDDYGSGYSNMNYLLELPFKMIKIDKYIVWAAFKNQRAKIALSATISMIKALGMTVLAEGVETEEQKNWLTEVGCDYLQGYYFSKAVPKEEFLKIMKEAYAAEKKADDDEEEIEELEELDEL